MGGSSPWCLMHMAKSSANVTRDKSLPILTTLCHTLDQDIKLT